MLVIFVVVLLFILALGLCMYIAIMGPSRYHRDGLVGKTHRMMVQFPITVGGFFCSPFVGCNQSRGRDKCEGCVTYTTQGRHWGMVGFYIVLVWTTEVLYLGVALPRIHQPLLSKVVSWGLVLVSEVLYILAVWTDPGTVTPQEHLQLQREQYASRPAQRGKHRGRLQTKRVATGAAVSKTRRFAFSPEEEDVLSHRYPTDGMLYALAGNIAVDSHTTKQLDSLSPTEKVVGHGPTCVTCHVARPSRSKHCRVCNVCVRRYDHHCPWINNDVAEGTHRYFLGFLLTHAISCTWAAVDLLRGMQQFLYANHAWGWHLRLRNGGVVPLTVKDYFVIAIQYQALNACLLFFAVCIGVVLYCFWAYQMSFVFANVTINDMNKIDYVVSYIEHLPSLDLLFAEAQRVRDRLEEVAERKPRALKALVAPDAGWAEGSSANRVYRKRLRKMLYADLKGLFDRGIWNNTMEVLWPYSKLKHARHAMATAHVRR